MAEAVAQGGARRPLRKAAGDAIVMAVVACVSLSLLLYVGFGEATRTLERFQIDKLASQGRYLQYALNEFLRPGHPIRQFVGFQAKTGDVLASDHGIGAIAVFDPSGRPVFENGVGSGRLLEARHALPAAGGAGYDVRADDAVVQVLLPLRNRFEQVATLVVTMDRAVVTDRVRTSFEPLAIAAAGAALGFGVAAAAVGVRRRRWTQGLFALAFAGVAAMVVATLASLYADGAQAKSKSMADTLAQRLSKVVAYGLDIWEFDGIDDVLKDYQALNPEMSRAGIVVDGVVRFHTDAEAIGRPWRHDPANYEYVSNMSAGGGRSIELAVAIPSDMVFRQTVRSVKNFAALFIASGLMAGVFLQIAGALRGRAGHRAPHSAAYEREADREPGGSLLDLAKPIFFVAVASEHLAYSFLPQYLTSITAAAGLSANYVSAPFTLYYLCFALSLLPAGHLSQRVGARPLMIWGLLASAAGLTALAVSGDFLSVCLARAMSGMGQGVLFIAIQSYILDTAPPGRKTRGAAIIVFGFQGGMITGMAIGSLLVAQIGQMQVFGLAAAVAALTAFHAVLVVPGRAHPAFRDRAARAATLKDMARDLGHALRDVEFMRAMLLVGLPAKAVLTGVVIFALPLMLSASGYRQEDIGQILMIYAAAVVLSSSYISAIVDRTQRTGVVLSFGCFLSASALIAVGYFGATGRTEALVSDEAATALTIVAVAVLGLAHGLINAPVVTHVASTEVARRAGAAPATATYRLLERIGHVAGPAIVGQLLASGISTAQSVAWVGGAVLAMAALFAIRPAGLPAVAAEKGAE